MNVRYLSVYFCYKYDYNRQKQLNSDNYDYIKEYYESIINNNLSSVIFYDHLSDDFIERYKNNNITFKRPMHYNLINKKIDHLHDERYFYFLDYIIENNDIDYFVLSDISDVVILKKIDEDSLDLSKNILYVGQDVQKILENRWFKNKYFRSNIYIRGDSYYVFKDSLLYNCGVILGHRKILISFLIKMCELFIELYNKNRLRYPLDMYVFNYILHKYYHDKIYLGDDFITDFSKDMYDRTKCIKHK